MSSSVPTTSPSRAAGSTRPSATVTTRTSRGSALETVATARTSIERELDPAAVRRLKETTSGDLGIGGAEIAAQAIRAGLVDEYHLFLVPVVVGAGKRALPDARLSLELLDERRFGNGTVYLRYGASR